ncbi:MAG: FAD-dependent oxidoreductase [Streptosporangiaceae bacterium]
MTDRAGEVLVIGACVAGPTTAVCLAEAGLGVSIQAGELPRQTTSAVAGAIWGPHLVEDSDRVTRWCAETLEVFTPLAADPATGIRLVNGNEATRAGHPRPDWLAPLTDLGPSDPATLPPGFVAGWRYAAPVVSIPVYLDYLAGRLRRAGVQVTAAPLGSLAQTVRRAAAPVIVNCTGAGARDFVPDPSVTPVRGQVVVAENPGITEFFIGAGDGTHELSYVFPHRDRVVLGGTEIAGGWSLDPRSATAERILADCAAIDPRLGTVRVLDHRVGLRPVRPEVRLETEASGEHGRGAGRLLVHNYGHGGAGVTLSWGCAREVARLVGSWR